MTTVDQNFTILEDYFQKFRESMKEFQSSMNEEFKQVMNKLGDLRASNEKALNIISELKITLPEHEEFEVATNESEGDPIAPEVEDCIEFHVRIEASKFLIHPACNQFTHNKVKFLPKIDFVSNGLADNTVIRMYCINQNELSSAGKMFDEMSRGVLNSGCAEKEGYLYVIINPNEPKYDDSGGKTDEAEKLVEGMRESSISLDVVTFNSRVSALCGAGKIFEELKLDVNTEDEDGDTSLLHAVRQGQTATAKYLIEYGEDLASSSEWGATTLHHSAGIGDIELLRFLLSRGAGVDSQNDVGTRLLWAACHVQQDVVKVLLEHHDDLNAEIDDNITPLFSAVAAGSLACIELLIQAGARVNANAGVATPLHIAVDNGNLEIINCLLNAGADPNVIEDDGSVFPVSNSSSSVIDCNMSEAKRKGVVVQIGKVITTASTIAGEKFILKIEKHKVFNSYPSKLEFVKRFWKYILDREGLDGDILWASISNNSLMFVASMLRQCSFKLEGKSCAAFFVQRLVIEMSQWNHIAWEVVKSGYCGKAGVIVFDPGGEEFHDIWFGAPNVLSCCSLDYFFCYTSYAQRGKTREAMVECSWWSSNKLSQWNFFGLVYVSHSVNEICLESQHPSNCVISNVQCVPKASNVAFISLPTMHIDQQVMPQQGLQTQQIVQSSSCGRMFSGSCPELIVCEESMAGSDVKSNFRLSRQMEYQAQRKYFASYWSPEAVKGALEKGDVFKAVFHVNAHNRLEANCKIDGVPTDIFISGIATQNRAVAGDIFEIKVDPLSLWTKMKRSSRTSCNAVVMDDSNSIPRVTEPVGDSCKGKGKVDTDCEYISCRNLPEKGCHNGRNTYSEENGSLELLGQSGNAHDNGSAWDGCYSEHNDVTAVQKLCAMISAHPLK